MVFSTFDSPQMLAYALATMNRLNSIGADRVHYRGAVAIVVLLVALIDATHLYRLRHDLSAWFSVSETNILDARRRLLKSVVQRTIGEIECERDLSALEEGFDSIQAVPTARAAAIEERAKARIAAHIRKARVPNDGYIWVNEILDERGGDGYAIRRVHPNLPETEGMLLSTETQDFLGNYPYRDELDGVLANEDFFQEYWFKKPGSGEIGKKLSYATYYEPWRWVVATGVYYDDMKPIIEKERERFDRLFAQNAALIVASSLLFLIPAIVLLVFLEVRLSRISASYRSRIDDYLRQLIEEKERTEEAYTQLKLVADRDFLTGLWTRRVVLERLNRETEPGAAGRFCVLIADIDHFKELNDSIGHEAGDVALQALAAALQAAIRPGDMAARWGGEEFLLYLASIDVETALLRAEQIRSAVSELRVRIGDAEVQLTVTIGVAPYRPNASIDDLIREADAAMYRGKAAGRNQVVGP